MPEKDQPKESPVSRYLRGDPTLTESELLAALRRFAKNHLSKNRLKRKRHVSV